MFYGRILVVISELLKSYERQTKIAIHAVGVIEAAYSGVIHSDDDDDDDDDNNNNNNN